MRPRQSLVEQFSTFLQFDGDRFRNWATDGRLRRSMEQRLEKAQRQEPENFWALYWHKLWRAEPDRLGQLAQAHLTAYVQEPCYWVAQKTANSFASSQFTLADCFQMAIAQADRVLRGFDAQQGFNFKSYASATLNSLIRENLRQRQAVDICTDWALLRKISQKRLTEALRSAGASESAIATSILAWTGFKLIYVPQQTTGTRKLSKPERDTWEAIARYYNSANSEAGSDNAEQSQRTATPETVEKWLATCAKAARAYLYPNVISINRPKPGQESGEFLDDLSETSKTESLLTELIAAEEAETRKAWRSQLGEVLESAIRQLEPTLQELVALYYAGDLTQQQIADRLQMKQYTISRRLTKVRESLLKALAIWGEETLHIVPTSDLLKATSAALEEWLVGRYGKS
ncbi:MAG: sigma-70 family RNA polymerase sigma factor [Oscillatoriophycideae cyanobacterium NC_groundwater_1537_Pr4_S-0.65um_50_18]|nr:sigma-70 family RNA polymerase sigma factor [Oscillatoriophycideae cyanobacterium NC_groundwater_1537_Pr4_S-0.65um_50_18]